jgi:hypothetical protein
MSNDENVAPEKVGLEQNVQNVEQYGENRNIDVDNG